MILSIIGGKINFIQKVLQFDMTVYTRNFFVIYIDQSETQNPKGVYATIIVKQVAIYKHE